MAKTKVRLDIRNVRRKYEEKWLRGMFKYEQDYLRTWLRDRCDYLAQLFSKFIAFKNAQQVQCKSCPDIMTSISQANGSHWIDKGRKWGWQYRCRWEKRNIHCCCIDCNGFNQEEHHNNLTLYMIQEYWKEQVEKRLDESRRTHTTPWIEELMEVVRQYEEDLRAAWWEG